MARFGKTGEELLEDVCRFLKEYFKYTGDIKRPVLGVSGGKDSSVLAALLKHAGFEPYCVLMPNGDQHDIDYSQELVEYLGLEYTTINIREMTDAFKSSVGNTFNDLSDQSLTNMPARVRMTVLYMVAQNIGGRVMNTCNLSEDTVGYATKYGDGAGDVSPLSDLTVTEVKELGRALGLPEKFIEKVPEDGLSGKTDEDNLGITYEQIDAWIEHGTCGNEKIDNEIACRKTTNRHKLRFMPCYKQQTQPLPGYVTVSFLSWMKRNGSDINVLEYVTTGIDYIGCILEEEEVHRFIDLASGDTIRITMIDGSISDVRDENLI